MKERLLSLFLSLSLCECVCVCVEAMPAWVEDGGICK